MRPSKASCLDFSSAVALAAWAFLACSRSAITFVWSLQRALVLLHHRVQHHHQVPALFLHVLERDQRFLSSFLHAQLDATRRGRPITRRGRWLFRGYYGSALWFATCLGLEFGGLGFFSFWYLTLAAFTTAGLVTYF